MQFLCHEKYELKIRFKVKVLAIILFDSLTV
jgi:hypothetical protein